MKATLFLFFALIASSFAITREAIAGVHLHQTLMRSFPKPPSSFLAKVKLTVENKGNTSVFDVTSIITPERTVQITQRKASDPVLFTYSFAENQTVYQYERNVSCNCQKDNVTVIVVPLENLGTFCSESSSGKLWSNTTVNGDFHETTSLCNRVDGDEFSPIWYSTSTSYKGDIIMRTGSEFYSFRKDVPQDVMDKFPLPDKCLECKV